MDVAIFEPLPLDAPPARRAAHYADVRRSIDALLDGEDDWISAMATIACELHRGFDYFHWTGFYRNLDDRELRIGPYQGGHGCLRIDFSRGVCGAAARTHTTQLIPDVDAFPGHIACSSTTRSELVVPVTTPAGRLLAVLDIDSDHPAAFGPEDQRALEDLCAALGARFADTATR
ncbi:GAF domain-containing protein [Haliangium sp.]|uniref:GAF domain-containing protein n=1 Tax=Haliangium sp. TaxID=2663208 RepID=UPI003D0DB1BD